MSARAITSDDHDHASFVSTTDVAEPLGGIVQSSNYNLNKCIFKRKQMEKVFLILILLSLLNCTNESDRAGIVGDLSFPKDVNTLSGEVEIEPPMTAEPLSPPDLRVSKNSKIIKTGRMNFEVSNLNQSKESVDSLLAKFKAYYENEQYISYGDRISYTLLIRVPSESFGSMLGDLESGIGKLISKNVTSKDVTEEYVDLNIRLENNLAYLSQYKEILKKAKSVEEILEVQEKVRRIEEEIESKKGRIQFLDGKVRYSTLNLEISEFVSSGPSNQTSFVRRMSNAFQNGIDGFLGFLLALINLWPFLLLSLLLLIFRKNILNLVKGK